MTYVTMAAEDEWTPSNTGLGHLGSTSPAVGQDGMLYAGELGGGIRHLTANDSRSVPVTSHPRLWLRAEDLPRLHSWAVDS